MEETLEFRAICKQFGPIRANHQVSFSIPLGSVHGIVGENGAGKSTLMNILYGYYRADSGGIYLDGQLLPIHHTQDAIAQGIGMVHQHFMLVDRFTVLENIVLGQEGTFRLAPVMQAARAKLAAIIDQYQLEVDLDAPIATLALGVQQKVEILKLIYRGANILILDEPTAVLTPQEADTLFTILRNFKAQGKTILLITHKMQEIFAITDGITVMRAGTQVAQKMTADTSPEEIAHLMIGRTPQKNLARAPHQAGPTVLRVEELSLHTRSHGQVLQDINFELHAGEILAIAGVSGNGQVELLQILSGMALPSSGHLTYLGRPLPSTPEAEGLPALFRHLGIAHTPEDRLRDGVIKEQSVAFNSVLGYQKNFTSHLPFGLSYLHWLNPYSLWQHAQQLIKGFDVRPRDPAQSFHQLSGGNQQKVVLGREIMSQPKLILVGQPTRGVDIGSIELIHQQLLALRDQGVAILLVSVELEEIRALADRILVMSGGKITGHLKAEEFDTTRIGLLMGGVQEDPHHPLSRSLVH